MRKHAYEAKWVRFRHLCRKYLPMPFFIRKSWPGNKLTPVANPLGITTEGIVVRQGLIDELVLQV